MNKRNIATLLILAVVAVGGYFGLGAGGATLFAPRPSPTPDTYVDELENLVSAAATLLPEKHASLAFKVAGQVNTVAVRAGQSVKKGDLLVRLDAGELEAAVSQAQAAVDAAHANLELLKVGPRQQDIAAAQANVNVAQAQLARVTARASAEEVAIVKASLDRAAAGLKDAQSAYDKVSSDPAVGMYPQSAALQLAYQEYRIAEARYNQVVKGPSAEEARVAQTGVALAQSNLVRAKAGPRPEELAAAQAHISEAEAALAQAQAALASAQLLAPFDGLVALVNVNEGELVTPAMPVVALGDVSHLRLETDDLSETSIARVQPGHFADVTFEALPGKQFRGRVTDIAPIATPKQGGTNYTVTIELEALDAALRWGMTGHVEINTK